MFSAPRVCRACAQPTVRGSVFCEKHAKEPPESQRVRGETDKMYGTVRWFRFRGWLLTQNPMCQKLTKGQPCRNPAHVVHHLISPRVRPDLFIDPPNTVCLCDHCHPGGTEGTPWWRPGVDYTPTKAAAPNIG